MLTFATVLPERAYERLLRFMTRFTFELEPGTAFDALP
jgi:hypothetical protein